MSSSKHTYESDNSNGDETNIFQINIEPRIGYFVANNFVLGFKLPLTYSMRTDDEDDTEYKSSSYAFAPFARYYFTDGNFKPYLSASAGLGKQITEYPIYSSYYDDSTEEITANTSLFKFGAGMAFFLRENIALDLELDYIYTSFEQNEYNDSNAKSISKGLNFGVGVSVLF